MTDFHIFEMSPLTSYACVVSVFLFTWFMSDVLLIRQELKPAIFWKQLDYLWLFVAFLGVLGVVAESRISESKYAMDAANREMQQRRTHVLDALDAEYGIRFCLEKKSSNKCTEVDQIRLRVKNYFNNDFKEIPLTDQDLSLSNSADLLIHLKLGIDAYNRSAVDFQWLKNQSNRNWLENFLKDMAPIFLVIAIALRLTKVTAEIELEKGRNH
jgi:hypothetical protein